MNGRQPIKIDDGRIRLFTNLFHLPHVFACFILLHFASHIACHSINLLFLLATVGLFALMDRLVMGAFQRRSGPYSIGWFGLLQPIVDGIKLIKKESIIVQK